MLSRSRARVLIAALALVTLTAGALWLPIPRVGNPQMQRISSQLQQRLPGWQVLEASSTWEGGYALVVGCGTQHIAFQVVPGHGLPLHDSWIQPNDEFTRSTLQEVSDYSSVLVWRATPVTDHTLSCREELARSGHHVADGLGTTSSSTQSGS